MRAGYAPSGDGDREYLLSLGVLEDLALQKIIQDPKSLEAQPSFSSIVQIFSRFIHLRRSQNFEQLNKFINNVPDTTNKIYY
jgi:hypothetical protein